MSRSTQCSKMSQQQNRQKSKPLKVGHYLIGQFLGRGGYASVYKAIQVYTQNYVAAKVIRLSKLDDRQLKQLKAEVAIHRKLDHPNIVKIYEVIWTVNQVYIFMEYLNGIELFQLIRNKGSLKEQKAVEVIYQLIHSVKYLHSKGVAHRDIKAQNIIVAPDYSIKLIDFGLSAEGNSGYLSTFCGSPSYIAPQIVDSIPYLGQKVDIWCIGVVFYVMLEGSLPFDYKGQKKINECIRKLKWAKPLLSSSQAIYFYDSIFVQAKNRKSIEQLLELPLFKKYAKVIQSFLTENKTSKVLQNQISYKHKKVIRDISNSFKLKQSQVQAQILRHQLGQINCIFNLLINANKHGNNQISKTLAFSNQKRRNNKSHNELNLKTTRQRTKMSIQLNNDQRAKTIKNNKNKMRNSKRQSTQNNERKNTQKKQNRRVPKIIIDESLTGRFKQGRSRRKSKQYIQISCKVSARIKYQNALRSRIQKTIVN